MMGSLPTKNPRVFINPVITDKKGARLHQEGCLSVPGIYEEVKRSDFLYSHVPK